MRKKNVFSLLLLLAALTLIFSGCGGKKNQETENPATDTAPPVAETSPAEPAPASLGDIIAALQSSMEANFGENFSLAQDGESLRVNVWRDGLGANANAIVAAGAGIPEQWTTIVNSFQSMSASIQTALDANGYQNISVAFNVLSELDKNTLLLSIVRDTVVYDYVAGGAPGTADKAEAQETLKAELSSGVVRFSRNVEDDVTGNWRLLLYSSEANIADYAVKYYQAFFEDDSEVHCVVNLGLETTTIITASGDGSLFVKTHQYVDKEEHSAKNLGSGMLLKSYLVNVSTGEIEDISG